MRSIWTWIWGEWADAGSLIVGITGAIFAALAYYVARAALRVSKENSLAQLRRDIDKALHDLDLAVLDFEGQFDADERAYRSNNRMVLSSFPRERDSIFAAKSNLRQETYKLAHDVRTEYEASDVGKTEQLDTCLQNVLRATVSVKNNIRHFRDI